MSPSLDYLKISLRLSAAEMKWGEYKIQGIVYNSVTITYIVAGIYMHAYSQNFVAIKEILQNSTLQGYIYHMHVFQFSNPARHIFLFFICVVK